MGNVLLYVNCLFQLTRPHETSKTSLATLRQHVTTNVSNTIPKLAFRGMINFTGPLWTAPTPLLQEIMD